MLDLNISLYESLLKSFKSNMARTQNMLVRTPAAARHSRSTKSSRNYIKLLRTFSTRYLPNRGINASRRYAKHAREHSSACPPRCCCLKKDLNASKPSEHPPQQGKKCLKAYGNIGCTKPLHGIKRVPQCNHIGSTV